MRSEYVEASSILREKFPSAPQPRIYIQLYIIMPMPPTVGGGIKRYRDPSVCPSVFPSPRRAAALGYRHAGCLQLSHVRTADSSADGRRSAASRTAIGGGISSRRPPPGRQLVITMTGATILVGLF